MKRLLFVLTATGGAFYVAANDLLAVHLDQGMYMNPVDAAGVFVIMKWTWRLT